MVRFFALFISLLLLAFPVSAASVNTQPTTSPTEKDDSGVMLVAASGDLAGGYYFVCDCTFGSGIKFYVPVEWAHNVFTADDDGDLVNLSTSTCYAYCPEFPSYTFSCSRFGTFIYRTGSSSTSFDLAITGVTDSNMTFLDDNTVTFSTQHLLMLIASLVVILIGVFLIKR